MIAVDAMRTDDGIERLESFCCEKHWRSESPYMVREVQEDVELGLVEPARGQLAGSLKEVVDGVR